MNMNAQEPQNNEPRKTSSGELLSLKRKLDSRLQTLNAAKEAVAEVQTELSAALSDEIAQARKVLGKPDGRIQIRVHGVPIQSDKPKKTNWDQGVLRQLYDSDDDLRDFISASFKVSETEWKAMGDNMRAAFAAARSVEHGEEKISFKESN